MKRTLKLQVGVKSGLVGEFLLYEKLNNIGHLRDFDVHFDRDQIYKLFIIRKLF